MKQELRVKYLFVDMKYPLYIKLQVLFVIAWLVGAVVCYYFAQDSQIWFLKNAPWLFPIIALLEIIEAIIAVYKAKKEIA